MDTLKSILNAVISAQGIALILVIIWCGAVLWNSRVRKKPLGAFLDSDNNETLEFYVDKKGDLKVKEKKHERSH